MPRRHELKCWPGPFEATCAGAKTFEFRRDDRGFEVGDELRLREWDSTPKNAGYDGARGYTGRWCLARVTYILRGRFDVPEGYCVMSLDAFAQGEDPATGPAPAWERPYAAADAREQSDEPAMGPAAGEAVEHWNRRQLLWEPAKVVYTFGDELIRLEVLDEDGTPTEVIVRLGDEQRVGVGDGTWRRT